jgi:hypothetical protein
MRRVLLLLPFLAVLSWCVPAWAVADPSAAPAAAPSAKVLKAKKKDGPALSRKDAREKATELREKRREAREKRKELMERRREARERRLERLGQ